MVAGTFALSGCFSGIKPIDKTNSGTTTAAQSQSSAQTSTQATTSGSKAESTPSETTSEKALKAYRSSIEKRSSDKYTVTWLIESNLPAKSGTVISENIYDMTGKVTESKGELTETYGGKSKKSSWYRTKTQYVTDASGNYKLYDATMLKQASTYEFSELVEELFSKYTTTEEDGFWVLKANNSDTTLNSKLMKYLGYSRTNGDAWEGSLYIEVKMVKSSGNLVNILYSFKHDTGVVTDTGEIKFSNYNLVNPIVIPEEVLGEAIRVDVEPIENTQPGTDTTAAPEETTTPESSETTNP